MVRSQLSLQDRLHRLANSIECQLPDLFKELLAEGRLEAAAALVGKGCMFIEVTRLVRDGREEGDA